MSLAWVCLLPLACGEAQSTGNQSDEVADDAANMDDAADDGTDDATNAPDDAMADDGADDMNDDLADDLNDDVSPPVDGPPGADKQPDDMAEDPLDPPDPDAPPAGKVPVFVAQGHLARTVISCDGGRTWIHDQSDVTEDRCWTDEGGIECDHQPTAGRGVTFGDGMFYATFGWGEPGSIRRSSDGFTWETVHEGSTFGGIEFGAGVLVAGNHNSLISADGESWMDAGDTTLSAYNVRRMGFADYEEGRFVLVAADDQTEVVVSSDGGKSWWHPDDIPASCGASIQTEGGISYGNGAIVIVGGDGSACASTDGGKTWEASNLGGAVGSHLVFDGSEFFAWGTGIAYHSADGLEWQSESTSPEIMLGPTAFGDGNFVGVLGGWQTWYEKQEFYRSEDGVNWEVIGAGTFTDTGHPIRAMAFGWLDPTDDCQ